MSMKNALTKLWKHPITIGDYVKVNTAVLGIYAVIGVVWYAKYKMDEWKLEHEFDEQFK